MEIHELPTDTPTSADYLAMDDGTSSRKTKFSDFEAGDNLVTFTNRDTAEPTAWAGFSVMESGTKLSALMNRISAAVANVRWLRTYLGSTALGTSATTISGAIRELVNKIGSTATGLTATTITGMIRELHSAIGQITSFTSSADVVVASSTSDSSVYRAIGQIDLTAGTWVVVSKARFSTNSTGVRRLNLSTEQAATGWTVSLPAANAVEDIQLVSLLSVPEATTYYLNAWQNSGSNLTCPAGRVTIRAMKVGV